MSHRLRPFVAGIGVTLTGLLLAGCAATASGGPLAASNGTTAAVTSTAAPTGTPVAAATDPSAEDLCRAVFPQGLTSWGKATVGDMRDYHYSGPVAHYPLKDAFPGVAVDVPGAWCVTVAPYDPSVDPSASWSGTQTITTQTLWGVIEGQDPQVALRISGPGDPQQGEFQYPPVVP